MANIINKMGCPEPYFGAVAVAGCVAGAASNALTLIMRRCATSTPAFTESVPVTFTCLPSSTVD